MTRREPARERTDRPGQGAAPQTNRWFFGPAADLFFGCGLAYACVFAAMAAFGAGFREVLPLGIAFLPVNLVASAHYGATALRAYERADDRRAYALFTLWTTLLLGAAFVAGLASVAVGSWIVTVYLTWSPWHYALQNFGVSMAFLRRRGIDVAPAARTLLHTSFVLSFVLAALALHGSSPRASYAPNQLESGVYAFVPLGPLLGVPAGAGDVLLAVAAAAYVVVTAAAILRLRRSASLRDLVPALVLIGTQALWFSVPVAARHWNVLTGIEPFAVEHAHYAFIWIGAGHAVQYLWFTNYFARRSGRSSSHAGFLTRSLLAGTALWTAPALLFAPGLLGRLPYDAGLAAMVAALVNLHHFVLDGVIWKLRDARIAGILFVRREGAGESPPPRPMPGWARTALWSSGTALLVWGAGTALLTEFGFNRPFERGDLDAARRASERLDDLGQASAERTLRLGQAALSAGDLVAARRNLERSVEVMPTAWAWVGIGDLHARREDWADAADAYARALALDPDHPVANFHAGVVALERGQIDRAQRSFERARAAALRRPEDSVGLGDALASVLADPRLAPEPGPPPR